LLWVVEGTLKSGTMVSARIALEESRDICVLPMDIDRPVAEGPIKLLKEGAIPITSAEDIAHLLDVTLEPTLKPQKQTLAPTPSSNHASTAVLKEAVLLPTNEPAPIKEFIAEEETTPSKTNSVETPAYNKEETPILYWLQHATHKTLHVDALAQQCGLPMNVLLASITMLELESQIVRKPGNHFSLSDSST
jgi:DNA processing protein